ncbi:pirin family protein [Vibrio amylolyticus]|uniref:pirin family protein n=1 Tax=Vibrio amylolyticus TaxID=2847292 RepID=UPI00354FE616
MMQILSRDSLPLGGFAGIEEHRLVTDSRIFGARKSPLTFEGIGKLVYIADAKYKPFGSSGMHPHSEIDIISIIVKGRVSHEGSLEHGTDLTAGDVQVQRAGGEGFSHDEINPDGTQNRMLQIWALPEEKGQRASYKSYRPALSGSTRIYGGDKTQSDTFDSGTTIDIVNLNAGAHFESDSEALVYVITGDARINSAKPLDDTIQSISEGDLVRSEGVSVVAVDETQLLVVRH